MKKSINVVGAIIENDDQEILCALRSTAMNLPNLWEFPGGKIDDGESQSDALKREINEELLCDIEVLNLFDDVTHEYEKFIVRLITYKCKLNAGIPTPTEHAKLVWLKRENLGSLVWAPADIPTVNKLITE
jgi:8-oxo-dGTP diphosphatase